MVALLIRVKTEVPAPELPLAVLLNELVLLNEFELLNVEAETS